MKKTIVLCIAFCFLLSACSHSGKVKFPSTQEYIVGQGNIQGNVAIEFYTSLNKAFEIGANAKGYAVFKNPEQAFAVFLNQYSVGIDLIKTSNELSPLTHKNYKEYKTYGCQTTTQTKEEQEQTLFVSRFLDIYKNSF